MNKRLKKKKLDVSYCQIVGPCSQILVVHVFSPYAFTFASCPLPPLGWNSLVWSDPSFCLKNWVEMSPKNIIFVDGAAGSFCGGMSLCWLSLTGRLKWIVALEMLLGCMRVAMDKCLWLLKHAGWCPKYRVDKAKSKEIQEVGRLTGKKKSCSSALLLLLTL